MSDLSIAKRTLGVPDLKPRDIMDKVLTHEPGDKFHITTIDEVPILARVMKKDPSKQRLWILRITDREIYTTMHWRNTAEMDYVVNVAGGKIKPELSNGYVHGISDDELDRDESEEDAANKIFLNNGYGAINMRYYVTSTPDVNMFYICTLPKNHEIKLDAEGKVIHDEIYDIIDELDYASFIKSQYHTCVSATLCKNIESSANRASQIDSLLKGLNDGSIKYDPEIHDKILRSGVRQIYIEKIIQID